MIAPRAGGRAATRSASVKGGAGSIEAALAGRASVAAEADTRRRCVVTAGLRCSVGTGVDKQKQRGAMAEGKQAAQTATTGVVVRGGAIFSCWPGKRRPGHGHSAAV